MSFNRKRRSSMATAINVPHLRSDEDSNPWRSVADDAHLTLPSLDGSNHSINDQRQSSSRNNRYRPQHHLHNEASIVSNSTTLRQHGLRTGEYGAAVVVIKEREAAPVMFGEYLFYELPPEVSDNEEDAERDMENRHVTKMMPLQCRDYHVRNNKRFALSSALDIIEDGKRGSSLNLRSTSWIAKPLAPPPPLYVALSQTRPLQSRIPESPTQETEARQVPE
jgi:hypothetical protein